MSRMGAYVLARQEEARQLESPFITLTTGNTNESNTNAQSPIRPIGRPIGSAEHDTKEIPLPL
jgi:hypothetical protein